jgi:hypothetical protein
MLAAGLMHLRGFEAWWVVLAACVLGALALTFAIVARRSVHDLGAVSANWIAHHRVETDS